MNAPLDANSLQVTYPELLNPEPTRNPTQSKDPDIPEMRAWDVASQQRGETRRQALQNNLAFAISPGTTGWGVVARMAGAPENVVSDIARAQTDLTLSVLPAVAGRGTVTAQPAAETAYRSSLPNLPTDEAGLPVVSAPVPLTTRSATAINADMAAQNRQPAWLEGTPVEQSLVPAGTRYQMVVKKDQAEALERGMSWFGEWATPGKVPSQQFARQELAILPEFKADVSRVVEVETTVQQVVNQGFVGPMRSAPGGGAQVQFVHPKNLRIVNKSRPLPEHTKEGQKP